jgi:hypothetical protein
MTLSDRAFRLLAREQPDVFRAVIEAAAPGVLRPGARLQPHAVDDPRLDLPPPLGADLVARIDDDELWHVEFQGYRDATFLERLLYYHLALAVRYRTRRVRTIAIWLIHPPSTQRRHSITVGDVTLRLTSLVLPEIPASKLLADPRTACFAAAGDPESHSIARLCDEVAAVLARRGASWAERHMAVVAAAAHGRYHAMVDAMERHEMEPVIVEDLVRYGEDVGYERGVREGLERGVREGLERGVREGLERGVREGLERGVRVLRQNLNELLAARGLMTSAEEQAIIDAEREVTRLVGWLRCAATAATVAELKLSSRA